MLGYFFFLRGLARLAVYLKSIPLMRRTRRQQIGSLALMLGAILAGALAASGGAVGMLLSGAVVAVALLVLYVLYVRLVLDLRRAAGAGADDQAAA
jgi:fatty acid desaturase